MLKLHDGVLEIKHKDEGFRFFFSERGDSFVLRRVTLQTTQPIMSPLQKQRWEIEGHVLIKTPECER
jgi:hypothetical protein